MQKQHDHSGQEWRLSVTLDGAVAVKLVDTGKRIPRLLKNRLKGEERLDGLLNFAAAQTTRADKQPLRGSTDLGTNAL